MMPIYDAPLHTNDQSLDRVLSAGLPVALVVWDSRRGLDHVLDEAIRAAARTDAGKLLIARIDTASNAQAAARWGGVEMPALVLYRDGAALAEAAPVPSADVFRAQVDGLLGRGPRPQARQGGAVPASGPGQPAPSHPVNVTDATFRQEVLDSAAPVVVDFWAAWCGPCRMIAPMLERLAAEFGGRVKIAKVNVDENPQTAARYGVQGIPTLLLVKQGRIADRIVGALPETYLRQKIAAFVK